MKTLREMMLMNQHRDQVNALREWAKTDPWKGLHTQLNEAAADPEATRIVRNLTASIRVH